MNYQVRTFTKEVAALAYRERRFRSIVLVL